MASSSPIVKTTPTGILQSSLSPKYLHTNSTSHTWPFSAIAELIDNAYDPDVKASQLWIDRTRIHGEICLTFTDNGNGMLPDKLHKMLSFGFCEKVADGTHMPVGHYGNGFKSGSMRLGKDALVLTKQEESRSIGFLSQVYLEKIRAETVVVPIATWVKKDSGFVVRPQGLKALKDVITHSLLKSEDEIDKEFGKIPGDHGTRIIISNIRKTEDNKPEFDFVTDEYDIRIPDDTNSESEKYRRTKRQNHVPECDYSLRAYCAILYLRPRMQIILRQKKVKTLVVEKSLSKTEVDRYKPIHAAAVKVVFGFSQNKNHYGIMMYHRNRLIKPYERVGHQLKANNLGVGVVGVVQCDFLQPTHNKQDFDYTKAYRACIHALGIKLNEYWNEKKGPVRSSNNSQVEPAIPEPQEIQALPDQTWVQCDEPTCLKWRKLPDGIDPKSLPEKWYCFMNPDQNYNSCTVPEEREDEPASLMAYEKVQKKRLVKEMEEKQKREKAAKVAEERDNEERRKKIEKLEEVLKKKDEIINNQISQLQDTKPKLRDDSALLPTAQVAPRPTTKPLSAVTPATKASPRQLGSQLAVRIAQGSQSANRTPQANQSTRSLSKPTPARSTPLVRSNQSTPVSSIANQSTPLVRSNQSTPCSSIVNLLNQSASRPTLSSQSSSSPATPGQSLAKPPTDKKVTLLLPRSMSNSSAGVTLKMVKTPNGKTFLLQEKTPPGNANIIGTKPSCATVMKTNVPAVITAFKPALGAAVTPARVTTTPSRPAVTGSQNTNVDVRPRLNVLPKPQTSGLSADTSGTKKIQWPARQTEVAVQKIVLAKQSTPKTLAKSPANTDVRPSHSLAATAYSEITGNTSTTPQDVKNILATGIKREATEQVACPSPAKVQRKKSETAIIVIDPMPSETPRQKQESAAEKRVKELESRVKELEGKVEEVRNEEKEKMEKLQIQLDGKSSQLSKRSKEIEEKKKEIDSKEVELKSKTRELKILRGNVCKLLQVLVPEIDVESEGEAGNVDDLLRQVLEANK